MANKIPIEHLTEKLEGLQEFLEDRNAILKAMWREDLYEDFLLKESMQDLDDVGGMHVEPIYRKGLDLSPVHDNEMIINTPGNQPAERFRKGGVVGVNPLIPAPAGMTQEQFQAPDIPGTSYKSLEETGFDDTLAKTTSNAIEEDFDVSGKLKKAFDRSLGLPARAAAAALAGLMSKVPAPPGMGGKEVIKNNIDKITNAFSLLPLQVGGLTAVKDLADEYFEKEQFDPETGEKKRNTAGLFPSLLGWGLKKLAGIGGGGPIDDGGAVAGMLGGMGDGPLWSGRQDMGYGGSLMGDGPSSISSRKRASGRFDMQTGTPYINNTPVSIDEYMKFQNMSMQEQIAQYGIPTSLKSDGKELLEPSTTKKSNMAAVKEPVNKKVEPGSNATDINQLTNQVKDENKELIKEKTDVSKQISKTIAPMPVTAPTPPPKGGAEVGSPDAVPKIKLSPYFEEYTLTSSY